MAATNRNYPRSRGWSALLALLLFAGTVAAQEPGSSDRGFRSLLVACDLPASGVRLTIDDRRSPNPYLSGKATTLSAFRAGSYGVKAEAQGFAPFAEKLTIDAGKIHTWIFHTSQIEPEGVGEKAEPEGRKEPALRFLDIVSPSRISSPALVLVDVSGTEEGLALDCNGETVQLAPLAARTVSPLVEGAEVVLAKPGEKAFFRKRVRGGSHAIVAIYRKADGTLAATVKVL